MATRFLLASLLSLFVGQISANSVVSALKEQIMEMKEGDRLKFEYAFQGCYGPYHHGSITMTLENDTVYFNHESRDDKNQNPLNEAGRYHQDEILKLLIQTEKNRSSEVLGNKISYKLSNEKRQLIAGNDEIEQRHFLTIFRPFSSIFQLDSEEIIPGLRTGGFVH